MGASIQRRNPEMVDLLTPDFQRRYEPNFALGNVISSFLSIPGLRGFWPMSTFDSNGAAIDFTGLHNLSNQGPATYSYGNLAPFIAYDGANDYLWVADNADHDIIGNESYVVGSYNGLSIGGWHYFTALAPANAKGVIGKWLTTGNQESYLIYINAAASVVRFAITTDGSTDVTVTSTYTLSTNTWYFISARFLPGNELSVTVNGTQNEDTNLAGIPATIFNGNAQFNIHAYSNGLAAARQGGASAFNFLSAMYISDAQINNLFNQSKALFGVH